MLVNWKEFSLCYYAKVRKIKNVFEYKSSYICSPLVMEVALKKAYRSKQHYRYLSQSVHSKLLQS